MARILAIIAVVFGLTMAPASAAPSDPQLRDSIPIAPACADVTSTSAGIKVFLVQRKLKTSFEKERYGTATIQAVKAFQKRAKLPVTGVVDETTWTRLGINKDFCIDEFTVQPRVGIDADREQRVEAMIDWANRQLGRPYIWGASGPRGYDCSGLVIQAAYAAGIYLPTITTDIHQTSTFPTSATMYKLTKYRLPLAERQRGDLIFWGAGKSVSHVAIHLGDDRIIEAIRPKVTTSSLWAQQLPMKPFVVRLV